MKKFLSTKKLLSICFLFFLTPYPLSLIPDAHADVPDYISYQGRLRQSGQPVNRNIDIRFSIYVDPGGGVGNRIWMEDETVRVSTGIFNHKLGSGSPIWGVFDNIDWAYQNRDYYLGVDINRDGNELLPRQQLEAVPYSFVARQLWDSDNDIVTTTTGRMGIGTTDPSEALHVVGNILVSGTVDGYDISASSTNWAADPSSTNEIQVLGTSGNDITLTRNGGSVTAPYAPNAGDADTVDNEDYNSNWPTTLANINTACSNDFHNIGGTDDDEPDNDSEVPNSITINNGLMNATVGQSSVTISGSLNVQNQVRCFLYRTISQGTGTIDWNQTTEDNYNMHDPGSNPDRITIPTGQSGRYLILANIAYGSGVSGMEDLSIYVGGTRVSYVSKNLTSGIVKTISASVIVELVPTNYITINCSDSLDFSAAGTNYVCVIKLN